jgi:hypothetical protein
MNITSLITVEVVERKPIPGGSVVFEKRGERTFFIDEVIQIFSDESACDGHYFIQLKGGSCMPISDSGFDTVKAALIKFAGDYRTT